MAGANLARVRISALALHSVPRVVGEPACPSGGLYIPEVYIPMEEIRRKRWAIAERGIAKRSTFVIPHS